MARTKAQQEATTRWNKAHMDERYARFTVLVPKARKTAVEARCAEKEQSISAYLNSLICADLGLTEDEWRNSTHDEKK